MSREENYGLRSAVASITHDDPVAAGREAADELIAELGAAPDLVLLFVSADLAPEGVVRGLYARLPEATRLVGCSSYAEINSEEGLTHSVTALGLRLTGIAFQTFFMEPRGLTSLELGRRVGAELASFAPDLVFLFPDILGLNATQVLLGLQEVLGRQIPIVGGAPGDTGAFRQTYQICDRAVQSGGAVGVALKGPIRFATAARSGYFPIGLKHVCTRVERGNVIREIDGRPALDVYRSLLGSRVSEMPGVSIEFPIGVVGGVVGTQRQADEGVLLVRAIFQVDEAQKLLVLGGDIPEGAEIQVTRATKEDVVRGAEEAAALAIAALPDPDLALVFNCMSRKVVLGPRYKEECAVAFRRIPPGVPRIGFYTFGELSPLHGVSMHHESTFTLVLLKVGA